MAYNMAKAAIDHMARTAAIELARYRIRVNVLHPGWIDTPGERKFFTDEQLAQGAEGIPWGRMGTPEEMGRLARFMMSSDCDYMTGSTCSWMAESPCPGGRSGKKESSRVSSLVPGLLTSARFGTLEQGRSHAAFEVAPGSSLVWRPGHIG